MVSAMHRSLGKTKAHTGVGREVSYVDSGIALTVPKRSPGTAVCRLGRRSRSPEGDTVSNNIGDTPKNGLRHAPIAGEDEGPQKGGPLRFLGLNPELNPDYETTSAVEIASASVVRIGVKPT